MAPTEHRYRGGDGPPHVLCFSSDSAKLWDMAKRKTKTRVVSGGTTIIRERIAAPIVRRTRRRRSAPVRRRATGRRRSTGIGGLNFGGSGLIGYGMGGFLYGLAVKQGFIAKLPAIPIIGRTGTAAIALDYFSRHGGGPMAGKAAHAAAVLAGYQLGSEGHITGDETLGMDTMGDSYTEGEYAEGMDTMGDGMEGDGMEGDASDGDE